MQRGPSARILNRTLTVTRHAWDKDRAGGKVARVVSTGTLPGTLQQVRADRVPDQLRASGAIDCAALFGSDPGVRVDDLIGDGATVMVCKAPALDEIGGGTYWVVYGTRKV